MNIYYSAAKSKFHVRKQVNGRTMHIGYFDTLEEAEEALDFFGQEEYMPPKQKRSEFEGKSIEWLKEHSNKQISELTAKYGPKIRRTQ